MIVEADLGAVAVKKYLSLERERERETVGC